MEHIRNLPFLCGLLRFHIQIDLWTHLDLAVFCSLRQPDWQGWVADCPLVLSLASPSVTSLITCTATFLQNPFARVISWVHINKPAGWAEPAGWEAITQSRTPKSTDDRGHRACPGSKPAISFKNPNSPAPSLFWGNSFPSLVQMFLALCSHKGIGFSCVWLPCSLTDSTI